MVVDDLFDSEGNLINFSNPIWSNMSNNLENKISANSLYISVYQDRNLLQTKLRELSSKIKPSLNIVDYDTDDSKSCNITTDESETDEESDGNTVGKQLFKFSIPYQDYIKMNPVEVKYGKKNNKKTYCVLKQGVWTNTINDWFIKAHKIHCNIIYKRCRISKNMTISKNFLTFSGLCKDCCATIIGWAEEKSEDGMPIKIHILMSGMQSCKEHYSKRPLNGIKRQELGLEMFRDCASNWKRKTVDTLKFGNKIPPNIYNNDVLWKCKQEEKDKILGITLKCPIMSLVELKHSRYAGSIHCVSADLFIVHYWTPCQIAVYKSLKKQYARISIDATGGIVKKNKRTKQGILSSHIFLYEAVISNEIYQSSVSQMISEKQNTFTIYSWLETWVKDVSCVPHENVCDYSMALLGAITRAFCNGITIRSYVESCLNILSGENEFDDNLTCFIRIDIAHLVKLICRWKCWKGEKTIHLKEFFVR